MIRIDLAKDELENAPQAGGVRLPSWLSFLRARGKKKGPDVATFALVALAAALGYLPHLFFEQYHTYIDTQHRSKIASLDERIRSTDTEVEKLRPFKKELESYEKQKKVVSERLDAVKGLLENRNAPISILDTIAQSLPSRMWISDIHFDLGVDPPKVKLLGQSFSNEEISDFIDKLSESVYIADTTLEEVVPGKVADNIEVKQFEIGVHPKLDHKPIFLSSQPGRDTASSTGGAPPAASSSPVATPPPAVGAADAVTPAPQSPPPPAAATANGGQG